MDTIAPFFELGLFLVLVGWAVWAFFYPVRKHKKKLKDKN